MWPAHWWGLFSLSLPRSVSLLSHSTPPFHLLSQSPSACPFSLSCASSLSVSLRLIQHFHTCIQWILCKTLQHFERVIVQSKSAGRLLIWLVAVYIWQVNTCTDQVGKRKTYFLRGGREATRDKGGWVCSAPIQDCAADFCLARRISGGWKIIWSWLWEAVGSGRHAGDVEEKVWGVTGCGRRRG